MSVDETTVHHLPEEMLEKIFSYLELEDRKSVAAVCLQWSTLAFRWCSLQLEVDFRRRGTEECFHRTLLSSRRPYRHLVFYLGHDYAVCDRMLYIVGKFSSSMESLKLFPNHFVPIDLSFLAKLVKLCGNVKKLHIDACNVRNNSYTEISDQSLNALQDLYMENNLLDLPGVTIQELAPNITALHVQISYYSERPLHVLSHFCPRLTELEVWFLSEDRFPSVCYLSFPLLRKLNFYCVDWIFRDEDSVKLVQLFFQNCPLLQEATLRCNMIAPVLGSLSQSCTNIHYLCLSMDRVSEQCFIIFSELKHLKSLRIEDATVEAPEPAEWIPVSTSMQRITFYTVDVPNCLKLNRFICHAYPALRIIELVRVFPRRNVSPTMYFYVDICQNMSSLERLTLIDPDNSFDVLLVVLGAVLPRLQEVRLKLRNAFSNNFLDSANTSVRTLALDLSSATDDIFRIIETLLPNLRKLTLTGLNGCTTEGVRRARERLPGCDISIKRKLLFEERP